MPWLLNISLALKAIRSNLLRASLTIAIIAIGIMALVGILTAIESIKSSIVVNLSAMGSNTFTIREKRTTGRGSVGGKIEDAPLITFNQAQFFKERYQRGDIVSINTRATSGASIQRKSEKTNPNITVMGVDENYLQVSGYKLAKGRNFSKHELENGTNSCLLGYALAKRLYDKKDTVENSAVTIGSLRYRVIGTLAEKGASVMNSDNVVLVTVQNARKAFSGSTRKYTISISIENPEELDAATDEATGTFRSIRKLNPAENEDFEISRSDKLATTVIGNIRYVTIAATLIGIITLIAAGIGLMNIMLVAVAERTREIGISKAIGATNNIIRGQFLMESVVICQLGGLLGIFFGILMGNVVSIFLKSGFIIPWLWITLGFIFCLFIGLAAGIYPAIRASRLDPIDALRYE
ncbi:MAG: ABC transporter permease [Chitinophagales bacterium]|nr:ABC transporter permease [Chitinophagales bacterium]